jgi:hypothetical protein
MRDAASWGIPMTKCLLGCLSAAVFLLPIAPAQAQTYPTRHITIVVPFTAGAVADTVARCVVAPARLRRLRLVMKGIWDGLRRVQGPLIDRSFGARQP